MTIPIRPIDPRVITPQEPRGIPLGTLPQGPSFKDTLARAIGDISNIQNEATNAADALARGEQVEIHEVMALSEEANLSLELLVEVRNKLAEAYRTIMNMQT
jgi:flagellar hook-basal body complex protein FliE